MLNTIVEILTPVLVTMATIAAPALTAVVFRLFQKWGIEIEAKNRDALQSALQNAAIIAMAKAGVSGSSTPKAIAIDYVKQSVPDAVKKFGLDEGRILDLLEPHFSSIELTRSGRL